MIDCHPLLQLCQHTCAVGRGPQSSQQLEPIIPTEMVVTSSLDQMFVLSKVLTKIVTALMLETQSWISKHSLATVSWVCHRLWMLWEAFAARLLVEFYFPELFPAAVCVKYSFVLKIKQIPNVLRVFIHPMGSDEWMFSQRTFEYRVLCMVREL